MPINGRTIRIFVSSTFCDMHAEREELNKWIFPSLRKKCEHRDVLWSEIDLRWGISDEQKAEGKVLPLCLEEISRCSIFICALGERYGWVPDTIPSDVTLRWPWLIDYHGRSVTELEIVHALKCRETAMKIFVYLRDPMYVLALPTDQHSGYCEFPTPEEVLTHGLEIPEHRAVGRQQKLAHLKDYIRASKITLRENYMNPKAFGELVSADVAAAIDEIYPPSDTPDVLDRDAADHAAFASSRSRIYIGRSYDMNQLDTHAHGQGPPLIILGESGVGKSALLANWALRYSRSHPNELVLMHFIGASPYSVEWENTVRRLISELNRRLNLEIEIPDEPDLLGTAFARALSMAGTKRRVVVMIDGLDQLSDRTGAQVLTWLPKTVPANICLLISTLPGHCLDELTRRSWPTLCVTPLTEDERRQFIADYLKQYGKQLGSDLVNRIAQHFATGNPLYLRALLEELRLYGSHHTLAVRIDHYLEAPKADALFELILERFEQDYDRERPGLVRDAMTMVWAGRRGLAEAELLDLLGGEDRPLPPAYWTPLHLAADAVLINRSGLIGFAHEYLRQAVERRYLPQAQLQYTAHGLLATYFASCELSSRKVEELPWQLAEIRNWSGLVETFSNLPFLRTAWKANSFEVRRYWARMTSEASIDMRAVYGRVLQAPHEYHDFVDYVLQLLQAGGHGEEATRLLDYQFEQAAHTNNAAELARCMDGKGIRAKWKGRLHEAWDYHRQSEEIFRRLNNKTGLALNLGAQAMILRRLGRLDEAMSLAEQQEKLSRELAKPLFMAIAVANQAVILADLKQWDRAVALRQRQVEIARSVGDPELLSNALVNQAMLEIKASVREQSPENVPTNVMVDSLWTMNRLLDEAYRLATDNLCVGLASQIDQYRGGFNSHLKRAPREWIGHAVELFRRGSFDGAMSLLKKAEDVARSFGDDETVGISLGEQAQVLAQREDYAGALDLMRQEEQVCRNLKDDAGLQMCLGNQAAFCSSKTTSTALRAFLSNRDTCAA